MFLQGEYTQRVRKLQHCLDLWNKRVLSSPFKNSKKLQTSSMCFIFQIYIISILKWYSNVVAVTTTNLFWSIGIIIMAALWIGQAIIFLSCGFYLFVYLSFSSLPILSRRRLDELPGELPGAAAPEDVLLPHEALKLWNTTCRCRSLSWADETIAVYSWTCW